MNGPASVVIIRVLRVYFLAYEKKYNLFHKKAPYGSYLLQKGIDKHKLKGQVKKMNTFLLKIFSIIFCLLFAGSGVMLSYDINNEQDILSESKKAEPEENIPDDGLIMEETFEYDAYDLAEAGLAAPNASGYVMYPGSGAPVYNNEKYERIDENGFTLTASAPLSTFAADVDTASYANVRRMIEDGWSLNEIYPDAVRAEEFVNYFSYDLKGPEDGSKFGVTTKVAACPWNEAHDLLFIGMKTEDINLKDAPARNLVFLIDVSGSMDEDNKLPLLKRSFLQLLDELDEKDTVSVVTYANGVDTVLDGVSCDDKDVIRDAINELTAEGGTYGEGGIQRAYEIAERHYLPEGNNRVILATDGDLNIGISEPDQLEKLISDKKDSGIYLSVLGFGMYNYRDDNMERLADCGNGNYAYIDSLLEAKKVLVEEMGSTLLTVADDVKLQVEFNPAMVNAYRLIGYEDRLMEATDFRDDKKDAGEIGAGHSVIALYELIPTGSPQAVTLKYQGNTGEDADNQEEELRSEYATVYIRYKEPGEETAKENEYPVLGQDFTDTPDDDFRFAAAAAEFAMILRNSDEKGDASLEHLTEILKDLPKKDEYREEFSYLVRLLSGRDY